MNRYDVTTPFNLQFDSAGKITLTREFIFVRTFRASHALSTTEFHGKKEIYFQYISAELLKIVPKIKNRLLVCQRKLK